MPGACHVCMPFLFASHTLPPPTRLCRPSHGRATVLQSGPGTDLDRLVHLFHTFPNIPGAHSQLPRHGRLLRPGSGADGQGMRAGADHGLGPGLGCVRPHRISGRESVAARGAIALPRFA